MSLSAALNSASTGLVAVSRGTEIVAGNISNAMTPGYGRREAVLTAYAEGGVRVASVNRMVTASLVGDARLAGAGKAYAQTLADFHTAMEVATGVAGSGTTLADKVGELEAALITAAARPDSEIRLNAVANSARDLVAAITSAASSVEDARTAADQSIASDVLRLQKGLEEVARLNRAIITDQAAGRDAASLMDDRQRMIDDLGTIVSVREVPRDLGRVAIYSTGGVALLDGSKPLGLSFAAAGRITAEMRVDTPPVARLMLDGEPVADAQMDLFTGGTLEANFRIRDELAGKTQGALDGLARDLVERFADPTLDPTLPTGTAGLFADRLSVNATPLAEVGLANRLSLNAALLGDGSVNWRLRDGLGASSPGEAGQATRLSALAERLRQSRYPSSSTLSGASRSAATLAGDVSARNASNRVDADEALARRTGQSDAISSNLLSEGVDTDAELRRLLDLEQAYAANARIIKAADDMISRILEI